MQIDLVEDGSEGLAGENANAFRRECAASGIGIHRFSSRAGLAGNWNRCLELSRGHFVHILHQDDQVRPQFYEAVAAGFAAEPTIGACFTQHRFITADGRVLRHGHLDRTEPGLLADWLEYVVANLAIQCAAIVVKRSVYERLGGFDDAYSYCLDRDMWQRIAARYPLWYDPAPLADYRTHERSTTASLARGLAPWLEARRCIASARELISPPARRQTALSARRHLVRLALVELRAALRARDWRRATAAGLGGLLVGNAVDIAAVAGHRYDAAPMGRIHMVSPDSDGDRAPRILLLTEFFPGDPARDVFGAFQRLRRHVDALRPLGPMDVVFFVAETPKPEQIAAARKAWQIDGVMKFIVVGGARTALDRLRDAYWILRGAVGFFGGSPTLRTSRREQADELRELLQELQPDLIFAHRLGGGACLMRANIPLPPVVVDVDDLEHGKFERRSVSVRFDKEEGVRAARMLLARRAERQTGKLASCLLVCSNLDRERLQRICHGVAIATIPNTAVSPAKNSSITNDPTAVFVGIARYPPNRDAIFWLTEEVWPRVRERLPDARLKIVGQDTESLGVSSEEAGIEVCGFVDDLSAVYGEARLVVCPVRFGSGTRIKVLEAASYARPVVSTEVGAEGLAFAPGREIMIADAAAEFADACVAVLSDMGLADRIGRAARRRVEEVYSAARIAERLRMLCAGVLIGDEGRHTPQFEFVDQPTTAEIGSASKPSLTAAQHV